jgi:chromosomal replication initiation ATPase DnaA
MVELTHEKFKHLQSALSKLKTGINELQLCIDELKAEMCVIDYSSKLIKHEFTMPELVSFGNTKYGIFKTSSRQLKNVYIRHSLIYLAREHGFTYFGIAKFVGLKHCTCIHACHQVEDHLFVKNTDFIRVFNLIVQEFNEYLEKKNNEHLDTPTKRNRAKS